MSLVASSWVYVSSDPQRIPHPCGGTTSEGPPGTKVPSRIPAQMPHQGHPPDLLGSEERLSHQNQGLVQAGGPWKVTILQGLSWSGTWDSQAGSHRPPLMGWAGLPLGALHKVPATPSAAICLVHVIWGAEADRGQEAHLPLISSAAADCS